MTKQSMVGVQTRWPRDLLAEMELEVEQNVRAARLGPKTTSELIREAVVKYLAEVRRRREYADRVKTQRKRRQKIEP